VAAIKESKTQDDDVKKDVTSDEGTAKETVDELLEKLKRKKPREFAFLKAEDISPEEHHDEPPETVSAEAPSDDMQPIDQPSESHQFQPVSSAEADLPPEGHYTEAPGNETPAEPPFDLPPVQAPSPMEQDLPPEESVPEEPGEFPSDRQPVSPGKKKTFSGSRIILLLVLFFVSLGLYAYFVYPTIYETRTIQSGDITYPVKINRLTKSMQYYHMGTWHDGPILKPTAYKGHVTVPPQVDVVPAEKEIKEAAEEARVQASETDQVPPIGPSTEEKKEITIAAPEKNAEKEESAVVEDTPPSGETVVKPAKEYFYAIQISSMRLKDFAEELLDGFKRKGFDAHMRVLETDKHGVWYTIYIGHFADREEAVEYIKEKNIIDSYPGSYIRKLSNS